jgi:2-phosphosulfolactate phosphatase
MFFTLLSPVGESMIHARVILRPADLTPDDLTGRTAVVFDVVRATTTMTAALAAGVKEIRVFDSLDAAKEAAAAFVGPKILCGEANTLKPPGFDLGNSPGDFQRNMHAGHTAFMATTNGTRAIVAARSAATLLVGALVNAQAVASEVIAAGRDLTLLCAGTEGKMSLEDLLGAGAVLDAAITAGGVEPVGDAAIVALRTFQASRHELPSVLRLGAGGGNLIRAGLEKDFAFCAALNSLPVVGVVHDNPLTVSIPGD